MNDRIEAIIFPYGLDTAWPDQTRTASEAIDYLCNTVGGKKIVLQKRLDKNETVWVEVANE